MDKDNPLKIEFAPGCFDNFEGTQEELDALIKEIQNLTFDDLKGSVEFLTDDDEYDKIITIDTLESTNRRIH